MSLSRYPMVSIAGYKKKIDKLFLIYAKHRRNKTKYKMYFEVNI
jgi:hypothetical protein